VNINKDKFLILFMHFVLGSKRYSIIKTWKN